MHLVSFRHNGNERFGCVSESRIRDLTGMCGLATLHAVLAAQRLPDLLAAAADVAEGPQLAEVTLLPPIVRPRVVFCIGVNYAERNAEYQDGTAAPAYPSIFLRVPESFVGHDVPIERPTASDQFDYEGEIALVIGKGGRAIPEAEALTHIAGLTLANEGTVRDWLRHAKFNVTQGKNFDRSGSIGPWLVTADTLNLAQPFHITTRVNGEVRQQDSTSRMMFPFAFLICYISRFASLQPGDVILTGTPTGAGARFDPPRWLVPGDEVEVCVNELGTLRNVVAQGV